jgi:hypothetical protein
MAIFGTYAANGSIIRASDGAIIPIAPGNADYAAAMLAVSNGDTIAEYTAPAPSTNPDDYPLQPYQFWAMVGIANLQASIDTALAAITDPTQKAIATAKLNHTLIFNRADPLVASMTAAAGLTSVQVDAYWMQAKDI